jgi:hypothetical protein
MYYPIKYSDQLDEWRIARLVPFEYEQDAISWIVSHYPDIPLNSIGTVFVSHPSISEPVSFTGYVGECAFSCWSERKKHLALNNALRVNRDILRTVAKLERENSRSGLYIERLEAAILTGPHSLSMELPERPE